MARKRGWPLIAAGMVWAMALVAIATADAGDQTLSTSARAADTACFWIGPYSTKRGPEFNNAFPDSAATYWTAHYTTPPGAALRLEGRFAHARYQSLHSYGAATRGPVDALNDLATRPDPGSTNPFRPHAKRTAKKRDYTVNVSVQPPPADPTARAPNTLYAGVAGRSDQELIYRVYVPDRGRNLTGGAGLPQPVLTLEDGTVLTGSDVCAVVGSEGNVLESSRMPLDQYLELRDQPGKPSTFPAINPPRFRAYYSTQYTVDCTYLGNCYPNPVRTGGQYSNVDNKYVGAFLNREFGAVLVLRGKMPTTPRTGHGEPRMGTGQLRYWSMCQNESLTTTAGAGCLYDEQVSLAKHRRYTIVTSLPADRPYNARRKCGVGYIPWPANGDGAGHLNDALLLMRNMLPSPDFHRAVQDTQTPGDEIDVMGPYLPSGIYMTTADFERRGC
jgi:hypothetical protein